jgi:hypothetical protein
MVWFLKMVFAQFTCFHLQEKSLIKNDPIAAPCFQLANHNDWSRWFAISSPPAICSSTFKNETWTWDIFLQGHILSTAGDAARWTLGNRFRLETKDYIGANQET